MTPAARSGPLRPGQIFGVVDDDAADVVCERRPHSGRPIPKEGIVDSVSVGVVAVHVRDLVALKQHPVGTRRVASVETDFLPMLLAVDELVVHEIVSDDRARAAGTGGDDLIALGRNAVDDIDFGRSVLKVDVVTAAAGNRPDALMRIDLVELYAGGVGQIETTLKRERALDVLRPAVRTELERDAPATETVGDCQVLDAGVLYESLGRIVELRVMTAARAIGDREGIVESDGLGAGVDRRDLMQLSGRPITERVITAGGAGLIGILGGGEVIKTLRWVMFLPRHPSSSRRSGGVEPSGAAHIWP